MTNTRKSKKKKQKNAAKRKPSVPGLTSDERARLMRPPSDFDEALASMAQALKKHRLVRVEGLSAAKLRSLATKAERTRGAEDAFRSAAEFKLRALADARMLAEDAAWRAALDVWDMAKSVGRRRPEILDAFDFMERYLSGGGRHADASQRTDE